MTKTKNDFEKITTDENNLTANSTKPTQKLKNAVLCGGASVIFVLLFLLVVENGLCDTKFGGPEVFGPQECPSNDKLIFNPEQKCYDVISLNEAKQRFGTKSAEALPNVYNMDVEYDEGLQEYTRRCYLAIDGRDFCHAREELRKLEQDERNGQGDKAPQKPNNIKNNDSGALLKNKRDNLMALYDKNAFKLYQNAILNKKIRNK